MRFGIAALYTTGLFSKTRQDMAAERSENQGQVTAQRLLDLKSKPQHLLPFRQVPVNLHASRLESKVMKKIQQLGDNWLGGTATATDQQMTKGAMIIFQACGLLVFALGELANV